MASFSRCNGYYLSFFHYELTSTSVNSDEIDKFLFVKCYLKCKIVAFGISCDITMISVTSH